MRLTWPYSSGNAPGNHVPRSRRSLKKFFVSFSFPGMISCTIDIRNHTINARSAYQTDNLFPDFTVTSNCTVTVDGDIQLSGVSAQSFSEPKVYRLTASNGSFADWTVTISHFIPVYRLGTPSVGEAEGTEFDHFALDGTFEKVNSIASIRIREGNKIGGITFVCRMNVSPTVPNVVRTAGNTGGTEYQLEYGEYLKSMFVLEGTAGPGAIILNLFFYTNKGRPLGTRSASQDVVEWVANPGEQIIGVKGTFRPADGNVVTHISSIAPVFGTIVS